jgi:small subunit ribosomal protein S13
VARIAGVDLPRRKRIDIALTYIYGIGRTLALEVIEKAQVEGSTRTDDLTEAEIRQIRDVLEAEYKVEGDLRRQVQLDIKRLKDLGCYRGLPARGQRTRTNARTRRGPRRTMARKKK